jgi:nicotinamide riboside transporter PnuC
MKWAAVCSLFCILMWVWKKEERRKKKEERRKKKEERRKNLISLVSSLWLEMRETRLCLAFIGGSITKKL